MHDSKFLQRIVSLILLAALLLGSELVLGGLLEPVSYADYFLTDLEEIEQSGEDPELVMIGASRVYRSFVPQVFEDTLGFHNVINAGSSGQPLGGSYHQLKELVKRFHPQYVVLGVAGDLLFDEAVLQAQLIVADRLPLSGRLAYMFDSFRPQDYPYLLSRVYRFRDNLTPSSIRDNLDQRKQLRSSGGHARPEQPEYYADTGFVYSYEAHRQGNIALMTSSSRKDSFAGELHYLDKITQLCQKEGIRLFLVTGPTSMSRIFGDDAYQFYHDWYSQYARDHGLTYCNLNYLVGRESLLPDTLMQDFNHTNGEGAAVISQVYAEVLKSEIQSSPCPYSFYESKEEMISQVNRVVSVAAELSRQDSTLEIRAVSHHAPQAQPLYKAVLCCPDGSTRILRDWDPQGSFSVELSGGDTGKLQVLAALSPEDPQPAFQEYSIPEPIQ